MVTLLINGDKAASGRIEKTEPTDFSFDETAGVGIDEATPVSDEYENATTPSPARSRKWSSRFS
jgi:hypothetical protein